ncbi:SCP-2 sterol transfer family protein [Salsuginibacillus halophilus]|uniref:SCP-2 sterol transfer family protein n=1 Tax=Salsuginibacillus halophilus TaxID=517424 RepID=A0A2P8HBI6_9BACI|nr:SCP2 sterol-binding domain-containing protein [Salsuginibacillus halophilus]PSL43588.1 SCP-2 sterol transfer family protein [Salsuginibacillus halophilus]
MTLQAKFKELESKMNASPEEIEGVNKVYQFNIKGEDESVYQVIFADGQATFEAGTPHEPQCTLKMKENDLIKLIEGNLNPTTAFMTGKLKVEGDMGQALKLQNILKAYQ